MAGIRGKSGPPGNQNAFRHGLAGIAHAVLTVFSTLGAILAKYSSDHTQESKNIPTATVDQKAVEKDWTARGFSWDL
jgi:hypothetical protein